jgi:hypothetical protein
MTAPRNLLTAFAAFAFAACATTTTPVVNHTHPASAEAPESQAPPLPRMLGTDAATQRTRELLAKRAAEAKEAEEAEPIDETNIGPTSQKPTGHENHQ